MRRDHEIKLEEALKEFLNAEGHGEGLLVDWFLITSQHIDEGDGTTGTGLGMYGPQHQRLYSAAGLLHYAAIKIDQKIQSPSD